MDPRLVFALAAAFVAVLLLFAALAHAWSQPEASDPVDIRKRVPWGWRIAWPLVRRVAPAVKPFIGAAQRESLRDRLDRAGFEAGLTAEHFVAAQLLAACMGAFAAAVLAREAGLAVAWPCLCTAVLGFAWPRFALDERIARRRHAILRQLPHDLDVVTLAVQAGLNLGAAIGQAARHGPPGPLRDEWQHVLRDVRAGQARHESLRAMAARIALPAVSNLVAALIAAERQGASLAPILRAQAEQRRNERFLRAERLAAQAPVKMLFPLVFFIFPGTFAILLFPVVYRMLSEGVL